MTDLQKIKIAVNKLKTLGLGNQKEVGRLLGYTNESSFSQVLNGKVAIPTNFISKLMALHPEVNNLWTDEEKNNPPNPNMIKLVESLERTIAMQERMIDTLTADKERLLIDNNTLRSENTNLRKQLEQLSPGNNNRKAG